MLRKKAVPGQKKSPSAVAKKAPAPKRAPAKRKLAEEFLPGEVLTDGAKKQWKLGVPVGQGGFGRLYLADENSSKVVGHDAPYVVKVEPSDNGPLFTELKFYMRAAKPDEIKKWISAKKLKYLGVPKYWGSGLHDKNGSRYRFMIMDRFGKDLQKIYEENGKVFTHSTVMQLGLRLLDILEYIHEHEYVHGDIKASNLLLHYRNPNQLQSLLWEWFMMRILRTLYYSSEPTLPEGMELVLLVTVSKTVPVYLVDYGLAYRFCPDGVHKEYKEDPRKCHDGTLEYTSIDAHKGVAPSRRGDLEILGYCMIQWLCGQLPWEDKLKDPNYVRDSKIRYRENISELMTKCFPGKKPDEIGKYMEAVKKLGYSEKPNYQHLRDLLLQGLKVNGSQDDGSLSFNSLKNGVSPRKMSPKKQLKKREGSSEPEPLDSRSPVKKKAAAKPKKSPKKSPASKSTGATSSAGQGRGKPARGRGRKKTE